MRHYLYILLVLLVLSMSYNVYSLIQLNAYQESLEQFNSSYVLHLTRIGSGLTEGQVPELTAIEEAAKLSALTKHTTYADMNVYSETFTSDYF